MGILLLPTDIDIRHRNDQRPTTNDTANDTDTDHDDDDNTDDNTRAPGKAIPLRAATRRHRLASLRHFGPSHRRPRTLEVPTRLTPTLGRVCVVAVARPQQKAKTLLTQLFARIALLQ